MRKWYRSHRPNDLELLWRVLGRAALLKAGPRVRIRLPPEVSQGRTRRGYAHNLAAPDLFADYSKKLRNMK